VDSEIIWTEVASADLHEIFAFISEQNPDAARRVVADILKQVRLLATVPYIGATFPRGVHGRYREVVVGKYRVFYQINDSERRVMILTIWHSSRREPKLP
jgi:addiction module RelE/StbE family toxin